MEILKDTISVYSTKGGVGKTLVSNALHQTLKKPIFTNDKSLLSVIKPDIFRPAKMPIKENCIYDFGGFKSPNNIEILLRSEYIIIPLLNESNSFIQTLDTLNDLDAQCDIYKVDKTNLYNRIIFLGNMITVESDKEKIKDWISKKRPEYKLKFYFLSRGKFLKNAFEGLMSPEDLYNTNERTKLTFARFFTEWQGLINNLKNGAFKPERSFREIQLALNN